MQYLGGKSRLGKKIAAVLNPMLVNGAPYYEPFCGGCSVARWVRADWRLLADAHPQLIAMWKAVQAGWVPPATVSEDEYAAAKRGELSPELTAFIGFGCSFGGKWFGGYVRGSNGGNYAGFAHRSILRKAQALNGAHFENADYRAIVPRPRSVVYCDPPYAGTTKYNGTAEFDSAEFWQKMREWSDKGHSVVVSEYAAPDDFVCVAEFPTKLAMHPRDGDKNCIERLFTRATRRNIPQDRQG